MKFRDIEPVVSSEQRDILAGLLAIFGAVLGCGLCWFVGSIQFDCPARASQIPEAPIYPGSLLISSGSDLAIPTYGYQQYTYMTDATTTDVLDFYSSEDAHCWGGDRFEHDICDGDSVPFGNYSVHIYGETDPTTYLIEISWSKCCPRGELCEGYWID